MIQKGSHRVPRQSQAWKAAEREAARLVGGKRKSRGSDFSMKDCDVEVKDLPFLKVDAKYRKSHSHHSLLDEIREKYCLKPGEVPVLVTKHHKQKGSYVTIEGEFFKVLMDAFRQLNVDPDVPNAALNKVLVAKGLHDEMPLEERGARRTNSPRQRRSLRAGNDRGERGVGDSGSGSANNANARPVPNATGSTDTEVVTSENPTPTDHFGTVISSRASAQERVFFVGLDNDGLIENIYGRSVVIMRPDAPLSVGLYGTILDARDGSHVGCCGIIAVKLTDYSMSRYRNLGMNSGTLIGCGVFGV